MMLRISIALALLTCSPRIYAQEPSEPPAAVATPAETVTDNSTEKRLC